MYVIVFNKIFKKGKSFSKMKVIRYTVHGQYGMKFRHRYNTGFPGKNIVLNVLIELTDAFTFSLGPVTVSSKPSYLRRGEGEEPREEVVAQDVAETGCAILGLYFSWVPLDERGSSARSVGFLQRANTMIRFLSR